MKIVRTIASGLTALAMVGGACLAQASEGPPNPGPEHQRLGRFVGQWTSKGEMKPGPFGPAGPMTWTESCEWFPGGFAVVCKSEGRGPMGEMKGLGILGYDAEEKVYTYYGVDNTGWGDYSTGTIDGKIWTYTSKGTMGGKTFHGRFVMTELSETSQTYKWEMSEDGKTWKLMMEGQASR